MKTTNSFWIIFIALLILHALVVLRIDFFPFADVPSHLAEGAIYKYYNEPSNQFNQYYTLNYLFYPNTIHLFLFSLPIFPDTESANKILHLLLVTTLPILVLLIINELQGNKWLAIASFILVYNYNLTFGFTGNAIANNAILLIIWLWLRTFNRKPNHIINMMSIATLLLLVYFSHAMVALFCALLVGCFLLYRYSSNIKLLALNSLTILPLGSLVIYWWFILQKSAEKSAGFTASETSTGNFMKEYYQHEFIQTFLTRAKFIVADNAQLFSGSTGKLVALVLSFSILIPFSFLLYQYLKNKSAPFLHNIHSASNKKLTYIFIFFGVSCLCYFLLPQRIPGQEPLYERFSTIILFSLILIASRISYANNLVVTCIISIIAFTHLGLWGQYFHQFDKENKDFSKILPQDNTKILSYLNYSPNYRGRMIYDHFQNYFIVRGKGISTTRIIDYRFGMIRRKQSGGLPYQAYMYYKDSPKEMIAKSDYLLVRGNISAKDQQYLDSVNTFQKVKDAGMWHLLKRR